MGQFGQFITHHWQAFLLLVLILILILINEYFAQKRRAKALSPHAAVALMNEDKPITIVDLRDKEPYNQGHILNAISATEADFTEGRMNKYKSSPILLVCARGIQSQALAMKLRQLGFNPLVLDGGMTAWQTASLPLVKTSSAK